MKLPMNPIHDNNLLNYYFFGPTFFTFIFAPLFRSEQVTINGGKVTILHYFSIAIRLGNINI